MDQNEARLHALEQLQQADERLAQFDMGTLAAIERSSPMLAPRVAVVRRIEASRTKKHTRKAAPARRANSIFDPAADHSERLLP